jgi:hypothetical protein
LDFVCSEIRIALAPQAGHLVSIPSSYPPAKSTLWACGLQTSVADIIAMAPHKPPLLIHAVQMNCLSRCLRSNAPITLLVEFEENLLILGWSEADVQAVGAAVLPLLLRRDGWLSRGQHVSMMTN